MRQLAILAVAVVAILAAPSAARCDDLDDLKAAHAAFLEAISAMDTNGFPSLFHEGAVVFLRHEPFPRQKPTTAVLKEYWSNLDRNSADMADRVPPRYAVYGTTGIITGYQRNVWKAKDGPAKSSTSRATFTYIKAGGKWVMLQAHISAIPSGSGNE